jgi:hypothetical protein
MRGGWHKQQKIDTRYPSHDVAKKKRNREKVSYNPKKKYRYRLQGRTKRGETARK